eukprot:3935091-Rhodomonas_salina.1
MTSPRCPSPSRSLAPLLARSPPHPASSSSSCAPSSSSSSYPSPPSSSDARALAQVSPLPVGVGRIIRKAPKDKKHKVAILSLGTRLVEAVKAQRMLASDPDSDIGVTVADARSCPLTLPSLSSSSSSSSSSASSSSSQQQQQQQQQQGLECQARAVRHNARLSDHLPSSTTPSSSRLCVPPNPMPCRSTTDGCE